MHTYIDTYNTCIYRYIHVYTCIHIQNYKKCIALRIIVELARWQQRKSPKMTWRHSERCWRATTRCPLSKRCRGLISTLRIRCSRFHAYLNFVCICMILTTLLLLLEILCCEMCCCGPKTSKPVRATFIVTLMFHLHPNFELINHLYLLLPMRTTDKFNDVIQKKKNKREIFCRHAIHGDDNACASHGYFMVWVLLVRGSMWVQLLILMNIVFHFCL